MQRLWERLKALFADLAARVTAHPTVAAGTIVVLALLVLLT